MDGGHWRPAGWAVDAGARLTGRIVLTRHGSQYSDAGRDVPSVSGLPSVWIGSASRAEVFVVHREYACRR